MPTIHFVSKNQTGEPVTHTVQAKAGESLMLAALSAGLDGIAADCGGTLTCATCHVNVPETWASKLPAATDDEQTMLDFVADPRQSGSRLSCQIQVTEALDGMTVEIPVTQY